MAIHLVAYTARTADGVEQGIAHVPSGRSRPSWAECHDAIPGYFTGRYLGLAPTYTLTYQQAGQTVTRTLARPGVESIGSVVMRQTARHPGRFANIAVRDADGADVTFDFNCFASA